MSNRIVSILLRGRVVPDRAISRFVLCRTVSCTSFGLSFVPKRSMYEKQCINRVTWFANILAYYFLSITSCQSVITLPR